MVTKSRARLEAQYWQRLCFALDKLAQYDPAWPDDAKIAWGKCVKELAEVAARRPAWPRRWQ
jgi:hypothetical protein